MSDESEEDPGADGSAGSESGGLSEVEDGTDGNAADGRPETSGDDPELRPDGSDADAAGEVDAAADVEDGRDDPDSIPETDPAADGDAPDEDAAGSDADPSDGRTAASDADSPDDRTGERGDEGSDDGPADAEDSGGLRRVETDDRPSSHKPNTMGPDDADEQAPPGSLGIDRALEDALPPGLGPGGPEDARGRNAGSDGPPPGHAAGAPAPGEPIEDDDPEGDPVRATEDGPGDSGTVQGMGIDGETADDATTDDATVEGGTADDATTEDGAVDDATAGDETEDDVTHPDDVSGIDPFPGAPDADERPAPGPEHGPDPGEGPVPPSPDHEPAPPEEKPTDPVREEPDYQPFPDDGSEPRGPPDDEEMPLAEHVEEMVSRLGVVVVSIAAVTALAFPFADEVLVAMWYGVLPPNSPAPHLYGPLEKIMAEIKLASLAGVLVALPVLVYESYLFMRPGLYPKERRYYLAAVPTSLILGAIGMAFAYFLILPVLFRYFIYYSKSGVDKLAFGLRVTFDLIVAMLGSFALVFQIPLLMMLAIMMGVTNREWIENRRIYFWGGFLGLGFLMGGADVTGMAPIIIAATMIGLFEGTLVLLRWTGR